MPYLLGPAIDPPALQTSYRPAGVYEMPDCRMGYDGCTAFEVWDHHRHCVATCSVANDYAAIVAVRLWGFFDECVDDQRAVVGGPPAVRPRYLGLV